MSFTNTTTHYGLPQYLATDKPKYLTDFNQTMVDIDTQMYTNAQAAATADGKAEAAKDVADGAVSSIGTLNAQINGDPTDPSDTGLSGQVSDINGDVNTIQSLIGTGTPTTSNQTIIGAINAIEGTIAPSEDSATLGANYAEGAQFMRGGVLYTALTALTSGTAFTSLTLNTDYKVSDPVVNQLESGEIPVVVSAANTTYDNKVSGLTADDVQEAIDEIVAALPTAGAKELQSGTLTAGQTSVVLTFAEQQIGSTSLIDVYVEDGINYTAIATTYTTVTLTFEAQVADKAVAVRVTN